MILKAIGEAIRDSQGQVDVANLALFWLMTSVLGSITFICAMVVWAFYTNRPFDPQPIGIAVASISGGFASALAALGIYIGRDAANRAPMPPKEG